MSKNTTVDQLANLHEMGRLLTSYPIKDREVMFTKWVDMLIDVGAASSVAQAEKMIAKDLGTTHQRIHKFYRGSK